MTRKQLIKSARDIPKDAIRQQVEAEGRSAKDYCLVSFGDHYLVLFWDEAGVQYVVMDDDDVNNFAVAQYLIHHGAPVYQNTDEVPPWEGEIHDYDCAIESGSAATSCR